MFYFILIIFFILPFIAGMIQILWEEDPVLTTIAFVVAGIWTYIENKLK